jgi:hypothetical protein
MRSRAAGLDWRGGFALVVIAALAFPQSRGALVDTALSMHVSGGGGKTAAKAASPGRESPGAARGALVMPRDMSRAVRAAQAVRGRYGVPVSVTLGQAMHESRPDLSSGLARRGLNYFGVKCGTSPYTAGCIDMDTIDYAPGRGLYQNPGAGFRRYRSPEASFLDYGRTLALPRYAATRRCGGRPACFLRAVEAGGYASPGYASRVLDVIQAHNLTKWDR